MNVRRSVCFLLFLSGCFPSVDEYREICTGPSGVEVFISKGADPELTCDAFQAYELRMLQIFSKRSPKIYQRLMERLPYTRVVIWNKDEHKELSNKIVDGYTLCDAVVIESKSAPKWQWTSLSHEYIHLGQDCDAPEGDDPELKYYYHHSNWCSEGLWELIDEVNEIDHAKTYCTVPAN